MRERATVGLLLLALFAVSCTTSIPTSISPSASAGSTAGSSAGSTVESASAQPTPAGEQVTAGPCCAGFALDPGRYATPGWFAIPLSLEVGTDWRAFRIDKNLALSFVRGSNAVGNSSQWLSLFAPANDEVDAFLADLTATPLLTFGDPTPIEIAGVLGNYIDVQTAPNPDEPGSAQRMPGTVDIHAMYHLHSRGITDFTWYTESAEARLRFIFVEIGDHTLILYLEAPPAEFDAYLELVDSVLTTIQIKAPA